MREVDPQFRVELETFESRRSEWLTAGYKGKWFAVRGTDVTGPFTRFADAWAAGAELFGADHLLVDRVQEQDRPVLVSRIQWDHRGA